MVTQGTLYSPLISPYPELKQTHKIVNWAFEQGERAILIIPLCNSGCFSKTLDPSYRSLIENYRKKYELLLEYSREFLEEGITVGLSWKIHILVMHVPQWLDSHSEGLSKYSEQTMEATHKNFATTYKRFKTNEAHPNHGMKLRRSAVEYSSRRI